MRAAKMKERPSFQLMVQTDVQSIYHMQKANTHKDNKKSLRATTGSSHLTVAGLTVYL